MTKDPVICEHTVGQLINTYAKRLETAKVYAPYEDAQALLAHAMGIEFDYEFPLPWNTPIDNKTAQKAESLVERRENREPLARIIGTTIFWGLKFTMADRVFRPDPHAEALVDNALIALEDRKEEELHILDLGTGSGCLLLALLHNLPNATGVGVDIDDRSINAAQKNAMALGLHDRAHFLQSSWAEKLDGSFDFIISNPPAVTTEHMFLLDPEMREYETAVSLVGGNDGLESLRAITPDIDRLLKPEGVALFRAHTWEREANFFKKEGFSDIEVKGNYRGNPWCVIFRKRRERSLLDNIKNIFCLNG